MQSFPNGYLTVEKLAAEFATQITQFLFVFGHEPLANRTAERIADDDRTRETCAREFFFVSRARDYDLPLFWLSADATLGADRTQAPSDIWLRDMKWPREVAIFLLPGSTIAGVDTDRETRADYSLVAVGLCRIHANEMVEPPIWIDMPDEARRRLTVAYPEDGLVVLAVVRGMFRDRGRSAHPFYHLHAFSLPFDIKASEVDATTAIPEHEEEITQSTHLAHRAKRIAVNAMLMLQARPELVESRAKIKTIHDKKRGRVVLWEPRWVGRKFEIKREQPIGTHASPRMHWRNGHWRNQAYGPDSSLRKLIWIEPTFVAAVIH